MVTQSFVNQLSYKIIGCAIEVHKILGPGLLENIYEKCLIHELKLNGLEVKNQQPIKLRYKGIEIDCDLRFDIFGGRSNFTRIKSC